MFGWIVARSINNHFIQQDVDELNAVVQALEDVLATLPPGAQSTELSQRFAHAVSGHHNARFQIFSSTGSLIYATQGSDLDKFSRLARPAKHITIGNVGIWRAAGRSEAHTSELQSLM